MICGIVYYFHFGKKYLNMRVLPVHWINIQKMKDTDISPLRQAKRCLQPQNGTLTHPSFFLENMVL